MQQAARHDDNLFAPTSHPLTDMVRKDMTFPNQTTLKSAIADLKEIVTRLHGVDTEPVRLLGQIEASASDIELKASLPMVTAAAAQTIAIQSISPTLSI